MNILLNSILYCVTAVLAGIGTSFFIKLVKEEKILVKKKNNQIIKKSCIKELHKEKINTPTMGGIVINIVIIVFFIGSCIVSRKDFTVVLFMVLFGVLGFIDDYIKIKRPKDGVSPKVKMIGILGISILCIFIGLKTGFLSTEIYLPFMGGIIHLNLIPYIFISVFLMATIVNASNITDGLDGLLLGIAIIIFGVIALIAFKESKNEIMTIALVIQAACIGTLVFNKNPAKVFIGDTGSLFLGGAAAILLIQLKMHIILVLVMGVPIWELISVVIQLTSLKFRNKKVFLIAPFHHHLEKKGWHEKNITKLFYLWTFILAVISIFIVCGRG